MLLLNLFHYRNLVPQEAEALSETAVPQFLQAASCYPVILGDAACATFGVASPREVFEWFM